MASWFSRPPRGVAGMVAAAAVLALAACGTPPAPAPGPRPAPSDATVVEMLTLSFKPETVRVPLGGTVEWHNGSIFTHTVTADPAHALGLREVELPAGAAPFDSGPIRPGQSFRHRFDVPGTYRYFCHPHAADDMVGTIVVTPAR